MKTKIILVALLMATSAMFAPLGIAEEQEAYQPTQEEIDQLVEDALASDEARYWLGLLHEPASIDAETAAQLYIRGAVLQDLESFEKIELARFLRDLQDQSKDSIEGSAFVAQVTEGVLAAQALPLARDRVLDQETFDALLADGTFESLAPAQALGVLANLGVDTAAVDRQTFEAQAILEQMHDILPEIPLSSPWQAEHWNELAITLGLVYLILAGTSPVAGSEFLPHNIQITALYIDTRITGGFVTVSWDHYYVWTELLVDDLLGAAFDIRNNVDSLLLQLPLSLRIEVHVEIRCSWGCTIVIYPVISFPTRTIGTHMTYEHAIPAMAGQPATRAESSDLLMPLYDLLGTLKRQKAREDTSAPPANPATPVPIPPIPNDPGRPGLGDLGTQSPFANYYGLQGDFSAIPATPALPPAVDVPDIHKRQRGAFSTPGDSTGTTVGHTSSELRAWDFNMMIVRLGNIGTGTNGVGPEPPASLYYDAGSYFTGGGPNQYTKDFSIRAGISP